MNSTLSWSDWPARRRPALCAFAVAVVAVFVGAAAKADPALGVLSAVILLGSTAEALLPTRFALSEEGVEATNPLRAFRKPWSRLGAWRAVSDGLWIDGKGRARILRRRGVLLRHAPQEAEVALREHLGEPS